MPTLAVLILTKNEGHNIQDCLKSAQGADELVVIDDLSTDNTVALAEALGAEVFSNKLMGFASQFNFALEQTKADWVFYLDADERCSPGLIEEIRRHILEKPNLAGTIVRKNFAFGQRHRFGVLRPDRVPRLFPRTAIRWEGLVHPHPHYNLSATGLKGHLIHLTYRNWEHYFNKFNHYTSLWAKDAQGKGAKAGLLSAFAHSAWGFFKMFIYHLGFLDGPVSWILCYYHFGYTLAKYVKLRELNLAPAPPPQKNG